MKYYERNPLKNNVLSFYRRLYLPRRGRVGFLHERFIWIYVIHFVALSGETELSFQIPNARLFLHWVLFKKLNMAYRIVESNTCTIHDGEDGLYHIIPSGFDGEYIVVDGGPHWNGEVRYMTKDQLMEAFNLDVEQNIIA